MIRNNSRERRSTGAVVGRPPKDEKVLAMALIEDVLTP
jgi:hypothetical protein